MRHSRSFKKRNISLENNNDKKRDFKFNEDYLIELSLLSSALISTYLFIISDIIFYDSTINSIEYIVGKNNANREVAELEASEAGYLELISKLILVNVDINRYNYLYKKFINEKTQN